MKPKDLEREIRKLKRENNFLKKDNATLESANKDLRKIIQKSIDDAMKLDKEIDSLNDQLLRKNRVIKELEKKLNESEQSASNKSPQ